MSTPDSTDLEMRLRLVEDKLEILNLLAGSPLSSDIASESYWESMFAHDAVMDRGGAHGLASRAEIMDIVRSADQASAIENGMAHVAALPHIRIDGDRAVATGYLQVLVVDPDSPQVHLAGKGSRKALATYHLTVNRWEFARTTQGWKVVKRTVRSIATPDGRSLLTRGIDSTD
jgi:hypothetical protein